MAALCDKKTSDVTIEDLSIGIPDQTNRDLERKLLRKLDLRMSIIVVIYTLNYVSPSYAVCKLGLTVHTLFR